LISRYQTPEICRTQAESPLPKLAGLEGAGVKLEHAPDPPYHEQFGKVGMGGSGMAGTGWTVPFTPDTDPVTPLEADGQLQSEL
jgi:hypothetical protein